MCGRARPTQYFNERTLACNLVIKRLAYKHTQHPTIVNTRLAPAPHTHTHKHTGSTQKMKHIKQNVLWWNGGTAVKLIIIGQHHRYEIFNPSNIEVIVLIKVAGSSSSLMNTEIFSDARHSLCFDEIFDNNKIVWFEWAIEIRAIQCSDA